MSLIFWRRTKDTGIYRRDGKPQTDDLAVSEDDPLPVRLTTHEDDDPPKVQLDQTILPPVAGQTVERFLPVPGIGAAAEYADGDAFGTLITLHNVFRAEKCSGTIVHVFLADRDDEGLQVDVPLFIRPITTTTDNSAFAVTDSDLLACRGVVAVSTFSNWNVNQFGSNNSTRLWVKGESPNLYTQLVARGAINVAAGAEPWLGVVIVPD